MRSFGASPVSEALYVAGAPFLPSTVTATVPGSPACGVELLRRLVAHSSSSRQRKRNIETVRMS